MFKGVLGFLDMTLKTKEYINLQSITTRLYAI